MKPQEPQTAKSNDLLANSFYKPNGKRFLTVLTDQSKPSNLMDSIAKAYPQHPQNDVVITVVSAYTTP